jgi:NAD(P)-dependent dehydrogenase (short-subunit alcohol dehydrogenase family)
VEALSEAMYYELGHFGIRVVIIEPGTTETAWQANEQFAGVDSPPYDDLHHQMERGQSSLSGTAELPQPADVAAVIAEAIETDAPRLRWPASPALKMVLAARSRMDDEAFEKVMRQTLGLSW